MLIDAHPDTDSDTDLDTIWKSFGHASDTIWKPMRKPSNSYSNIQ